MVGRHTCEYDCAYCEQGVLRFGFGRDVLPQNLKEDPYKYQIFQEKVTHSNTDQTNFAPNFEQNHLIWKILKKNRPIHIPYFAFYKGSFIYQKADFATHVGHTSL